MSTLKTVLRAAALTAALGTMAAAPPAYAANMSGFHSGSAGGFHGGGGGGFHGGGGGFHGGGFHGGGISAGGFHNGGVGGTWFRGGGIHSGLRGGHGLHHVGHGHFRGNVWIVDPGWYGYDGYYAPYIDDSAYNLYCDPDSEYYDPNYCDSN